MHAIAVGIAPTTGRAIDRNADCLQKDTIRGSGRHGMTVETVKLIVHDRMSLNN